MQLKYQTTWNLELLYKSLEDPQIAKDLEEVQKQSYIFIDKWKNRSDYLNTPKILKQAMDEYESWLTNYNTTGKVAYYLYLNLYLDQANKELKAKIKKLEEFSNKISNDIQFFLHKLSKIDTGIQSVHLSSQDLSEYRHFLERIFLESKFLLSEKEEKILNLKSGVSHGNWVKMLNTFLSQESAKLEDGQGELKTKSFEEILDLLNDPNKKIRDKAAIEFNKILERNAEVAENEFNSVLENKKINDQLRGYASPQQASLLGDDVDAEVVDSLISSVGQNYQISKDYYQFKAKLFGMDKLAYHERNLDYGCLNDQVYTWQDSVDLVAKVLGKLDVEFAQIFTSFVNNGQLDVFPRQGKSAGAFCTLGSKTTPVYILLNHTQKLRDITTIAHEVGHGINHFLMNKYEKSVNFGDSLFTAEVASTFMEDFVIQEIFREADEDLRLALMVQKLNDEVSTIFRQVAFYQFEIEIHQQFREAGYLSRQKVGQIFQKYMAKYMGEYVSQNLGSENWWIYVGHFRRMFYVYSYASGILISKSMQHMVKQDPSSISKVKKFLSTGSSISPRQNFSQIGIDITKPDFWSQGIQEVAKLLEDTIKLAKKLGKI